MEIDRKGRVQWGVRISLVLLGAVVGWSTLRYALQPVLGHPAPTREQADRLVGSETAQVKELEHQVKAAPGDQVLVSWQVTNSGLSAWPVDEYRFVPLTDETTVLSLPATIRPGETAIIRAALTVPPCRAIWRPSWYLVGPRGSLLSGRLTTAVFLQWPKDWARIEQENKRVGGNE